MKIRKTTESDRKDILDIHKKAFGGEKGVVIAKLVDDLLDDIAAKPALSLVAVSDDKAIGRISIGENNVPGPTFHGPC